MDIPLQGRPGIFDARNPTLVSNVDQPYVTGDSVSLLSPADYAAVNPRADGVATASLTGSVTTGDELTLTVFNPLLGNAQFGGHSPTQISKTYTTVGGDTLTTIAEAFAVLFNDDADAQSVGLRADVAGAVITFRWGGPIGNLSIVSSPVDQPSTITVGGTALTNDALNVLFSGPAFAVVANAQETATVGGTVAPGNVTTLTFTNSGVSGLPVTLSYTAVGGDTPASVAAALVALAAANATLQAAEFIIFNNGGLITVRQPGALGNNTVLTDSVQGSVTLTFGNGGNMAGGKGIPGQTSVLITSATTTGQSATTMAANLATAINANPALTALAISGSASGAKITMTVPAALEPVSVTGWINTVAPKATITGSVVAGDVIGLTVTNVAIVGGSASVSYTALTGDTTTSIATGLKNAINASALLIAAGITASSSTNVVTFLYPGAIGQLRFSSTVSPGAETVTLSATPTETLFFGTSGTEVITVGNGATAVVAASVLATVAGTGAAAATVALTFTNAGVTGLPITKTYTCVGTDSATTVAAGLVALINGDATLQAAGISASNVAGAITILQQGAIGNSTVMTTAVSGGGSAAITFTPSNGHLAGGLGVVGGIFSGGTGPIVPSNNFQFERGGSILNFRYGEPQLIDYPLLSRMVSQGMPIV